MWSNDQTIAAPADKDLFDIQPKLFRQTNGLAIAAGEHFGKCSLHHSEAPLRYMYIHKYTHELSYSKALNLSAGQNTRF